MGEYGVLGTKREIHGLETIRVKIEGEKDTPLGSGKHKNSTEGKLGVPE